MFYDTRKESFITNHHKNILARAEVTKKVMLKFGIRSRKICKKTYSEEMSE